jgi:hypothetical protein
LLVPALLAALTVWILLLLLSGLLATALLLTGLLAGVLILLARILVLVGHSGSPLLDIATDNGEIRTWLQGTGVPLKAIARKYRVATKAFGTEKLPSHARSALLPHRVPTVRKNKGASFELRGPSSRNLWG